MVQRELNNPSTLPYPFGIILPCLKLSLISELNLEEIRKMRTFPLIVT